MSSDSKPKNTNQKVIIFDVDGVLIIPPKLFSDVYCEKYDVDLDNLLPFYSSKEFKDCSINKLDLKEAIKIHNDKWLWNGDPADLIREWLEAENRINQELLKIVGKLRDSGIKVYLASQQEKYRASYLREEIFKDLVDGFFISCDLGLHKDTSEFWKKVLELLKKDKTSLRPEDIAYFDDRQKLVNVASQAGINACIYKNLDDVTKHI